MRWLLCLSLTLPFPCLAQDTATEVLVTLFDEAPPDLVAALQEACAARGCEGAALLLALRERCHTELGRARAGLGLQELRRTLRSAPTELPAMAPGLAWELGLGRDDGGRPLVYFPATCFDDQGRLQILEYLLVPEPPPEGYASKSYEALAGIAPGPWQAFRQAWEPEAALWLRWQDADGTLRSEPLAALRPELELRLRDWGLYLGGNLAADPDRFPPPGAAVQVGFSPNR